MNTDLSVFDNGWYKPGRSRLVQLLWYYVNAWVFASYWFPFSGLKAGLLRLFGAKVGRGLVLKPRVSIKYPWRLVLGQHVWIGEGVWIDNLAEVRIDDHCCVSQGALLLCGNHDYGSVAFDLVLGPIHLQQGVWIGAKAIVGPGVVAQQHAVLALGSVASKGLDAYGVYRGNPAVKVKERKIEK